MNKRSIQLIAILSLLASVVLCLAWTPTDSMFDGNSFSVRSTPGANAIQVNSDNVVKYTNSLVFNGGRFLNTMPFVLTNLWQATTFTSNANFAIICIGDSLMVNKIAPLGDSMDRIFGTAGFGFNHAVTLAGGATQLTGRYTNWMSGTLHSVPVGGTATYTVDGTTGFIADSLDIFYFTTNGVSTITISTNFNGGSYATALTIDANTGSLGIAHTNIFVPRGIYTLRVGCSAGSALVPASPLISRDRGIGKGVCILQLAAPGLGWNEFTNITTTIITNLGAILPKGPIIVEESSDAIQWLASTNIIERLTRHQPRDVIIVSPNPFVNSSQEATNRQQIAVMKAYSVTNGWTFFDQHSMFGSAAAMVSAGLLDPSGADVHPNLAGRSYGVEATLAYTGIGTMLSGIRAGKWSPIVIRGVTSDYDPQYGIYQNTIGKPLYLALNFNPTDSGQIVFQDRNDNILAGWYVDPTLSIFYGNGGGHILAMQRVTGAAAFRGSLGVDAQFTNSLLAVFNGGIHNNGSALKHARVSTGSVAAGASAVVTVTWPTAFANTSYTAVASVVDTTASSTSMWAVHIESQTASAVTVRVENLSASPITGTVHVIAMHD